MKMRKNLINIAEWIFTVVFFIISLYLAAVVFMFYFEEEYSYPHNANILLQFLAIGGVVLGGYFIGRVINKYEKINRILTIVLPIVAVIFIRQLIMSYLSQTLLWPETDQKSCFDIACRFLESDFGAVVPKDSYLSLWPFQTGFIFMIEKSMRIFKDIQPLLIQKINCYYILLMVLAGYGIVCTYTKRMEAKIVYLLLMCTNFPLFLKSTYIYGDVPGFSLLMISSLGFIRYFKETKVWKKYAWVSVFSLAAILACVYKRNCMVFLIAGLIVVILSSLKKLEWKTLAIYVVTMVLAIGSTTVTQKYYERYAGNECGKGVPAVGFIAMGLQYNGEEAIPGGWNGFHSSTYMNSGYDYEFTVQVSKESIQKSLDEFSKNPGYMSMFFNNKVIKQWANQTHGVYWRINGVYDTKRDQNAYWVKYLENKKYTKTIAFEDYHESIVYGFILIYGILLFWNKIKRRMQEYSYLILPITFIGGFLFSLIWEGQTGAVMYYPILLLPVAIGFVFSFLAKEKSVE